MSQAAALSCPSAPQDLFGSASIRRCSFSEVESSPNLEALLQGYGEEYPAKEFGPPNMQVEMYRQMEQMGIFHVIGAFRRGLMVGFAGLLSSVQPHFGHRIAVVESLFVLGSERKSGAGMRLIRECERMAKELGAFSIGFNAPTGSRLERLLPNIDYRKNATSFCKVLA